MIFLKQVKIEGTERRVERRLRAAGVALPQPTLFHLAELAPTNRTDITSPLPGAGRYG
jgi:hypothetical protein